MKTRLYTVHLLDDASDDGLVLVKEGFSWPAFFVAVPWALFHRMWWVAGALMALQIALGGAMSYANFTQMQQVLVSLIVALGVGYAADELRRSALRRRGYVMEDVVMEENTDRALRRFLGARPAIAARLAEARS